MSWYSILVIKIKCLQSTHRSRRLYAKTLYKQRSGALVYSVTCKFVYICLGKLQPTLHFYFEEKFDDYFFYTLGHYFFLMNDFEMKREVENVELCSVLKQMRF